MIINNFDLKRQEELFLEALRTLPVPEVHSGEIHFAPEMFYEGMNMGIYGGDGIIPFLHVNFHYDVHRRMFVAGGAELESRITHPEISSPKIQKDVNRTILLGGRPHFYTIDVEGLGKSFDFGLIDDEFVAHLREGGYLLTRGDLVLSATGDRSAYSPIESLYFQPRVIGVNADRVSPEVKDWFEVLKQKYERPEETAAPSP